MSNLRERTNTSDVETSSTSKTGIVAVLFDYGQVLSLGPNTTAWERLRSMVGGHPEQFHEAYWRSRHDYDRGTINGATYWAGVAETSGHPGLNQADLDLLFEGDVELWTDLNEPMVAWARNLQRRGIRTGILSNIGDRMEAGIRDKFDWVRDFHHCTWSHRLKIAKPEIEIYQHAAKQLQTQPEHVLFIDDREENVDGALAAGMIAVRYTKHAAFVDEMQRRGFADLLSRTEI